jgi:hypothetical protein
MGRKPRTKVRFHYLIPRHSSCPHGRGEVTFPNNDGERRDVALRQTNQANGYPFRTNW